MIIIILKLIAYFLVAVSLGLAFLKLVGRNSLPAWLMAGLSFGAGAFLVSVQLFIYFFIFKLQYHYAVTVVVICEAIISLAYLIKSIEIRNMKQPLKFFKLDLMSLILIILIFIQIIFIMVSAITLPTIAYDSLTTWALRAKILFYNGQISFDQNDFYYLGHQWHNNYPWLIPLNIFFFSKMIGSFDDTLFNFIFLFFYLSILILLYAVLRKFTSRLMALVFVFLFSTMQLPFYHAFNAYADLPLSYYILCAFIFFFYFLKEQKTVYLVLMSLFMGIAFFVKQDALIFVIAMAACLGIFSLVSKKQTALKNVAYFIFIAAAMNIFWIYYLVKYNLGLSNVAPGLGFHPEIFKNLVLSLLVSNNWNIFWYFFAAVPVISWRAIINSKELLYSWLFFFAAFTGFICLYLFTNLYRYVLDNTAVSRNILLFVPMAVALTGLTLFYRQPQAVAEKNNAEK